MTKASLFPVFFSFRVIGMAGTEKPDVMWHGQGGDYNKSGGGIKSAVFSPGP
jgi:hypothetical protein